MNIIVLGAGAIGSLIGGLLSKQNNVILIGREKHVNAIKRNGLEIIGKTNLNIKIQAETNIKNINIEPDLLILTVKSYDTEKAIKQAKNVIKKNTTVLSIQNGIDNISKITKNIDCKNIVAGVTTHGCIFLQPGIIKHTGIGKTILGDIKGDKSKKIAEIFNKAGIKTKISKNIIREIWIKTIINSSINPLTALFQCKNGYLLRNPVLENIVEKICYESTNVANTLNLDLTYDDMLLVTKKVIKDTSENFSSMLQSIKMGKKTEIDSINGKIVEIGKEKKVDVYLNELLVFLVKYIYPN